MKLSRESEYGLAGLVHLARQRPGTVLAVKAIAAAQALPRMFLAKTFRKLTRHGVLRSYRGRQRGYELARAPREISVREILEGIEGMDLFMRCIFWSNACSEDHPCLLHGTWTRVRPQVMDLMAGITLADLARDPAKRRLASRFAPRGAPKRRQPGQRRRGADRGRTSGRASQGHEALHSSLTRSW
jgi:Rrf2 family transcriptional regulator, iron-sulfur cluster assembly transcription factor